MKYRSTRCCSLVVLLDELWFAHKNLWPFLLFFIPHCSRHRAEWLNTHDATECFPPSIMVETNRIEPSREKTASLSWHFKSECIARPLKCQQKAFWNQEIWNTTSIYIVEAIRHVISTSWWQHEDIYMDVVGEGFCIQPNNSILLLWYHWAPWSWSTNTSRRQGSLLFSSSSGLQQAVKLKSLRLLQVPSAV